MLTLALCYQLISEIRHHPAGGGGGHVRSHVSNTPAIIALQNANDAVTGYTGTHRINRLFILEQKGQVD